MPDWITLNHPDDAQRQYPRTAELHRFDNGDVLVELDDRDGLYTVNQVGCIAADDVPRLVAWLMPGHDTDDEHDVATALHAADAGNAGHWPTVAGVLADEVRRLRATAGVDDHSTVTRLAQALAKLREPALGWSRMTTNAWEAYRREARTVLAEMRREAFDA